MYGVGFMPSKLEEPETIYNKLFRAHDWEEMAGARRSWLRQNISGTFWCSKPMNFLMNHLKEQVRRSIPGEDNPRPVKLRHESFLAVLDEALGMEGWPEKDHLRNVLERLGGRADEGGAGVTSNRVRDGEWTPPMSFVEPPKPLGLTSSASVPTKKRPHEEDALQAQDKEGLREVGVHKRVRTSDQEERPKKRRRTDEPHLKISCPTPAPSATQGQAALSNTTARTAALWTRRASGSTAVRQAEGRSPPASYALLHRIMRSRCCGFWRHLLRR